MSTANTADPLFMAGAVAVGMFGNPRLAGLIMAAHYLGALATGVLMKFYCRDAPPTPPLGRREGSLPSRALQALVEARRKDGRPLGQLLGDAVRESVNTLLLIGGFIILFSVIIQMLRETGIVAVLVALLGWPLGRLGVDPATLPGLVSGIFEITIGTQAVAGADASVLQRAVAAGAVIAWSGLSVLGQVAAVTQGTDVRLGPYIVARVFHALAAAVFTVLLFDPVEHVAVVCRFGAHSAGRRRAGGPARHRGRAGRCRGLAGAPLAFSRRRAGRRHRVADPLRRRLGSQALAARRASLTGGRATDGLTSPGLSGPPRRVLLGPGLPRSQFA